MPDIFEEISSDPAADPTPRYRGHGMFFYTVEEGQRALVVRPNGTMDIIVGPSLLRPAAVNPAAHVPAPAASSDGAAHPAA